MRDEIIQIEVGCVEYLFHVQVFNVECGLNCYKVYRTIPNFIGVDYDTIYCTLAPSLEEARKRTEEFLEKQWKSAQQTVEYRLKCEKLQSQLNKNEVEFKEYFSFLLNAAANDWVKIDRIKLTKNEHLYRATRVNTGTTYYEITRKTGREELKVLFKKVIEYDIKERNSTAKWKHVGKVETRKEGLKIVYEFFNLKLSNDSAVYKIIKIETKNEHTKVDDFMIWEDELVKEDRILRYMDNMKDNYLTLTKQMDNIRKMITSKDEVIEAQGKELKNAQKRLEEQKEQIEDIEAENDFLNEVTEAQIEEIKKLQEIIKRIKLKHSLEYEYVEKLERQKQHLKVVLRAEAVNRGRVQIKDFEEYVEKVLDDFL